MESSPSARYIVVVEGKLGQRQAGAADQHGGPSWPRRADSVQISLALVAIVAPWLAYGLLWQGAPCGRRILLAAAGAGVVVTTWLALVSAQT